MNSGRLLLYVRYIVSGTIAALIQLVGLYVWVSVLGLESLYLLGVILLYCIALITTFTLQKYWTFRERSHEFIGRQVVWYTLISLGNLALNAALLHTGKIFFDSIGADYFQGWYLVVQAISTVMCAVLGFLLNRHFTFRMHLSSDGKGHMV